MDAHPTPYPGNKAQLVKSKYKKTSEPPKQKIKETAPKSQRRTFGTIRDPNVPEKTLPQKPKAEPSNKIPLKQPKPDLELAKHNHSSNKKKAVSIPEVVKTPVRPPFSAKPVKNSGTPYFSAEKHFSCPFDRLETSAYWLGQIKSAEAVGKHFVSAAFFGLARDCKAEPASNLDKELKKYLKRHDGLSSKTEWEHVSRVYGILKNEYGGKSSEDQLE